MPPQLTPDEIRRKLDELLDRYALETKCRIGEPPEPRPDYNDVYGRIEQLEARVKELEGRLDLKSHAEPKPDATTA